VHHHRLSLGFTVVFSQRCTWRSLESARGKEQQSTGTLARRGGGSCHSGPCEIVARAVSPSIFIDRWAWATMLRPIREIASLYFVW